MIASSTGAMTASWRTVREQARTRLMVGDRYACAVCNSSDTDTPRRTATSASVSERHRVGVPTPFRLALLPMPDLSTTRLMGRRRALVEQPAVPNAGGVRLPRRGLAAQLPRSQADGEVPSEREQPLAGRGAAPVVTADGVAPKAQGAGGRALAIGSRPPARKTEQAVDGPPRCALDLCVPRHRSRPL